MSIAARGVQSVEVGARLLRVLADAGEPMMLRDLARLAGVAPAQAHAYLVSYRRQGLVERAAGAGRYRLGPFALLLGIARMRGFDPMRMAADGLPGLAAETGLSAILAVWGTHGPTVVQVAVGLDQIYTKTKVATVYSVSGTATGRVFAAFLPQQLVRETVRLERREGSGSRRVGRPVSWSRLAGDLAGIRERGYATVDPAPIPGVRALSAPVFNHAGRMEMAVTLIGPADAFDTSVAGPLVTKLLAFTRFLSARLGYEDADRVAKTADTPPARTGPSPSRRRPRPAKRAI